MMNNDCIARGPGDSERVLGAAISCCRCFVNSSQTSPKSGKPARLEQLLAIFGIDRSRAMDCRYQLLHRPVTATLEAKRFRLSTSLFLVQAFGENNDSFADYTQRAKALGVEVGRGDVQRTHTCVEVDLWVGWVDEQSAAARDLAI